METSERCSWSAGLLDKEQVTPMLADPDMQSTTRQLLHSLSIKGGQKFAEQTGEASALERAPDSHHDA